MNNRNLINVVLRIDGDDGTSAGTGHIMTKNIRNLFKNKKIKFKFFILLAE